MGKDDWQLFGFLGKWHINETAGVHADAGVPVNQPDGSMIYLVVEGKVDKLPNKITKFHSQKRITISTLEFHSK